MRFRSRSEAGTVLAGLLKPYASRSDVVVLGLPRGGVVVAAEVAAALRVPLDVFVVRKLGVPGREELAMGAIASDGVLVLNDDVVRSLQIPAGTIDSVARREQRELARREALYRGDRPGVDLDGKTAILVDDGLATGATMRAAVIAARAHRPAGVVVAVPAASRQARDALSHVADEVVCTTVPDPFWGVGASYDDFRQTTDAEVTRLLRETGPAAAAPP